MREVSFQPFHEDFAGVAATAARLANRARELIAFQPALGLDLGSDGRCFRGVVGCKGGCVGFVEVVMRTYQASGSLG